jgi:hypothetical protein
MTKITKPIFISTLDRSLGTITDLSRRLKVTHGAVCNFLDKNPEMRTLFEKKRLSNVDRAEDVLFEHLNKKGIDPKIRQDSAKYIASRLGKHKGWSEKTEVEHSGNTGISINLIEKDVKEIKDAKEVKND